MSNVGIVSSIVKQQLLISAQKWSRIGDALIPEQNQPTARLEDSHKLLTPPHAIKPMPSLGSSNEIHAGIGQSCSLSRSCDAFKVGEMNQQFLASLPHLHIRLDSKHRIAIFQQDLRPNTGSGSNVSDNLAGRQCALSLQ